MTDTHSHIYTEEFSADRDDVVDRARLAGVDRILLPNINEDTIAPMLALCDRHPGYCFPMMGLHPEDVGDDWQEALDRMGGLLRAEPGRYVAIGEVGLDFYRDDTRRREQTEALARQVEWSIELRLPLMIHCRDAHRELVDVLSAYRGRLVGGVFHCFSGSLDRARELLSFPGFALGIGGVLTFRNCRLPAVVRELPLERMVLETDAPYLAPVPHRGERNESAFVEHTMRRLAEEKGLTPDRVARVTDAVAMDIFFRGGQTAETSGNDPQI